MDRAALIRQYMGLPTHILNKLCRRYPSWKDHWDDLLQEGCIGLCVAADKYDNTRASFMTYAWYWVNAYIRAAADRAMSSGFTNVREGVHGSTYRHRRTGAFSGGKSINLNGSIDNPNLREGNDQEFPEEMIADAQQHGKSELRSVMSVLDLKLNEMKRRHGERDVEILRLRLLAEGNVGGGEESDNSYTQLSRKFGLSRERIRQIENKLRPEIEAWASEMRSELKGFAA